MAIREPDGHDPAINQSKAVELLLRLTVRQVLCYHALGVSKGELCPREWDPMLFRFSLFLVSSHSNLTFDMAISYKQLSASAI